MSRIAVAVESTVGTVVGKQDHPTLRTDHPETTGWPVGWGWVVNTLGPDGQPVEALVLMPEPALPGAEVQARPVAILHLVGPDRETDELVCVTDDVCFDDLVDVSDLPRWHADPAVWAAALKRLSPGSPGVVVSCGQRAHAERWLAEAQDDFVRMTGWLD